MAKKMAFTDDSGNEYEESYWQLVQLNLGIADGNAHVVFYGYRSLADAQAKRRNVGQKTYDANPDQLNAFAATPLADLTAAGCVTLHDAISQVAWGFALSVKDVPAPTEEDPGNAVSFFEGAVDA